MASKCRLCNSSSVTPFCDFGTMPISRYYTSLPTDKVPSVQMDIVKCSKCSFIQNKTIPDLDQLYQSEHYATAFQKPKHLCDLISTAFCYSASKKIIDVGSNDGALIDFLSDYVEIEQIVGLEPNSKNVSISQQKGHTVYSGYLNNEIAEQIIADNGRFDIVIARHVLEHVPDFISFLASATNLMKNDGLLVLELPDVDEGFCIGNPVIIWEEHVNYFTKALLDEIFKAIGMDIVARRNYVFGGGAYALFIKNKPKNFSALSSLEFHDNRYINFADSTSKMAKTAHSLLNMAKNKGYDICVYGCGPRTSTFINHCKINHLVDHFIDDREDLEGLLLPGTYKPIVNFNTVSEYLSSKCLVLLGVGAETEPKIIQKTSCLPIELKFISMFHPKDSLTQMENMIERL